MTPLDQFGSTSTTTTTITSSIPTVDGTCPSQHYVNGICQTVSSTASTIVQSHPTPDFTIPLLIVAVLVMVLVVIAVFRHRSKK